MDMQCWLVGGGMAILAAAVHLIQEAKVSGHQIHIIEIHAHSGHEATDYGSPSSGYTIHAGLQPCFNEPCMKHFLSLVPYPGPEKTLLELLECRKQVAWNPQTWTRLIKQSKSGPARMDARKMHMRLRDQIDLATFLLESEDSLADRSIRQCFDPQFFDSTLWVLWSTTFAIQPQHSAAEFQRHLSKYLDTIEHLSGPHIMGQMQYTFRDSVLVPTIHFLKRSGVTFEKSRTADLFFAKHGDRDITVSRIDILNEHGMTGMIAVKPTDIVIASLGPSSSASVIGSHHRSSAHELLVADSDAGDAWGLWNQLALNGPLFGNPSNFQNRLSESKLVTFTITLRSPLFIDLYTRLTNNEPGAGTFTTAADCSWHLTINVPHQPVLPDQPKNIHVVWGYGMSPERDGDYIAKPMYACSGEEIMVELLAHLGFPAQAILPTATVIPCIMPYATSALLTRSLEDRPPVIPPNTSNLGLVGQFVDIPQDTTFSMDYNIRSAQIAVYDLMGLDVKAPAPPRSHFMRVFDLLK
ncbi:oleate hydratase [Aspergillus karnatakaensis]|uniref:oleate hydratase n=1 Tax=Aspergillus karnatakaensis TaxID=1810916 RepID=UPI003CCD4001